MPYKDKEKNRRWQREWVAKRKAGYLQWYGPCYFCGSEENLEIHHIDPSEKESHNIWTWERTRLEAEMAKCIVLCHDCHVKIHTLMKRRPFRHGTYYAYHVYKCRCPECRSANADARQTGNYKFTGRYKD